MNYEMVKAHNADWNAEEKISKAIITWADNEWEYENEIENEDMTDLDFKGWIEKYAEDLAREFADEENTNFDELIGIDYEYESIDYYAKFKNGYENACEFDWECRMGR